MRSFTLASIGAVLLAVTLGAAPAQAVMTQNQLGCTGTAEVFSYTDGRPTGGRAAGNHLSTLVEDVPREGIVLWRGSGGARGRIYTGRIGLVLGTLPIVGEITAGLYTWGPPTPRQAVTSDTDRVSAPAGFKEIPSGRYRIAGEHRDEVGRCAGYVDIELAGAAEGMGGLAPLGAVVLAALGAFGLGYSATARRVTSGAAEVVEVEP